jgi:hypothetical protein
VNLRAIARVDRDWRGEPVIVLKGRDETLAVSGRCAPVQGHVASGRAALPMVAFAR